MAAPKLPTMCSTPAGRLNWPNLFTPKFNDLAKREEWSAELLFPEGADLSTVETMVANAATNKWGPDRKTWPTNWDSAIKSQQELIDAAKKKDRTYDHFDAKGDFIRVKKLTTTKDRQGREKKAEAPKIVDKDAKTPIVDEQRLYSGCWAKLRINAFAYDKGAKSKGVTLYFDAVQFVRDGERLSGAPSVENAFEAIPEDAVDDAAFENLV